MRAVVLVVALVAINASGSVDVPTPVVKQLSRDKVLEACGGHSRNGCTQFREAALLCECREGDDGWRVEAAVRVVPSVYVDGMRWVQHEMLHVADFRHFLRTHVSAMGSRRFETVSGCERYTRAVMNAFAGTLRRIARISADRRDGQAVATSEDHLVVVKAEIMPELVNDGLADLANDLPAAARHAQNRPAKDRDLIGKGGEHVEAALRQSDAAVNAQQLVVRRTLAKDLAVLVSRLFFDDDHHVVEQPRKLVRKLFESLFDELLEFRSA